MVRIPRSALNEPALRSMKAVISAMDEVREEVLHSALGRAAAGLPR